MNTCGQIFRFTSFGESHGEAVGGIVDGMPSGVDIDIDFVQAELSRRKPGSTYGSSKRSEADEIDILSGVFEGKTIGTPIAFIIRNSDSKSSEYAQLKDTFRSSHADDVYETKYGERDYRGGGRASARETAARVAAGAFAKIYLSKYGIKIFAYTEQIGEERCKTPYYNMDLRNIYTSPLRCPQAESEEKMQAIIKECIEQGDTVGGCVFAVLKGLPKGLGEPIFDKITSKLSEAMLSIPACRGFEIGQGFSAASMRGSVHNDTWKAIDDKGLLTTEKNLCGGVRGGISTGEDLYFRLAFKPISTLMSGVSLWSEKEGEKHVEINGRHDVCCVPRAVPVVEAMAALVLTDLMLLRLSNNIL